MLFSPIIPIKILDFPIFQVSVLVPDFGLEFVEFFVLSLEFWGLVEYVSEFLIDFEGVGVGGREIGLNLLD